MGLFNRGGNEDVLRAIGTGGQSRRGTEVKYLVRFYRRLLRFIS
jgi:hypothetical protein